MEVFVYGTLTDPDRARAVLESAFEYGPAATVVGLRRVEGRYPTFAPPEESGRQSDTDGDPTGRDHAIAEAPAVGEDPAGGISESDEPRVAGRILRTDRVEALDDYEGVEHGLYVRLTLPVLGSVPGRRSTPDGDRSDRVTVYVGDPDRLGLDGVHWPGDGEFGDRVRNYVERTNVGIRIGEE